MHHTKSRAEQSAEQQRTHARGRADHTELAAQWLVCFELMALKSQLPILALLSTLSS